jgi:hypothetical protein
MMARWAFLVLPIVAFGQIAFGQPAGKTADTLEAPPGVEKELRARVTTFYQFFVDGFPRKAEPFVAEDTKDFYYSAAKLHFESFRVDKVTFFDDFTKAMVVVVGKTERHIGGQAVLMDVPQETHWKIEDGKWCWTYHAEDYSLTPMSEGKNPPIAQAGLVAPLKDTSDAAIRERGMQLLREQPMGLDKNTISMKAGEVSTAQVVFTNGSDGYVQIAVNGPVVRGLSIKFDKMMVPGHSSATLTLHYDPSEKSAMVDAYTAKGTISFQVLTSPINKMFPLSVSFEPGK